jgi:branched-subunit amino acid aminotransferase/4-amino-4-deoxychorismate lyase
MESVNEDGENRFFSHNSLECFRMAVINFAGLGELIMRKIDLKNFGKRARALRRPFHKKYYAMYSSVYGGIVTDPVLMMLPIDDHMVHRGDGIFEVFKCVNGNIYNLDAHFKRLERAAAALKFRLPAGLSKIRSVVVQTIRAGRHKDCYIHLYVSRGPGSFSVNPYDCPAPQLYIVVTRFSRPFMEGHPKGARLRTSSIVAKSSFYAAVKSCNYLPNVLMKKEAVDLGVDFVVAFDEKGFLAEGATENVGIVTRRKELLFPKLDGILSGTTMMRVMELAKEPLNTGELTKVGFKDISRRDVRNAREILIVGTTPNVTFVREFDGRPVGKSGAGSIHARLSDLLFDDMHCNRDVLTQVF